MNIYIKWSLLVALNLPITLMFALGFMKTIPTALGVIVGIIAFILMYVWLDKFLLKSNELKWRKALLIGVGSCAILLLFPGFPMISGALALDFTASILNIAASGQSHTSFIATLFATVTDGFLLSLIVVILTGFARLIFMFNFFNKDKKNDK